MEKYILVTAEKFGYGPIITCLNIVKELKKHLSKEVKLIFLGTSIAKEQAISSNYFDQVIECETFDYDKLENFETLFRNAKVILCSENQFGAIYAKSLNLKNVFFVDNLMWMWDKITPGLENVDKYFISETFDSKENFKAIGSKIKNPVFIGPLREIDTNEYVSENNLLINFGGAESFMLDKDTVISFYKKILSEVLTPKVIQTFKKITVCGGSGVTSELQGFNSKNVFVKTLTVQEYFSELHKASHIIMSSGLGNFIESVGIQKNIFYLPPINYSQLLQIKEYKKLDLGFKSVSWSDYPFYQEVPELLDEEVGVNMVVDNVKNYLKTSDNLLSKKVDLFVDDNSQKSYFEKRHKFISQFQKDGALIITNYVIKALKE